MVQVKSSSNQMFDVNSKSNNSSSWHNQKQLVCPYSSHAVGLAEYYLRCDGLAGPCMGAAWCCGRSLNRFVLCFGCLRGGNPFYLGLFCVFYAVGGIRVFGVPGGPLKGEWGDNL